ncbi:MAG: ABC transporter ATP-binding protein [Proteobacteria bacterium]|nr:ABC transporter ATP-binding protein [Pseudomonadota bacterium]
MIKAENLSKHYGALKAVDGISFAVKKGEVLGFLGPNGAGKTTTMKLLTGFLAPTAGKITIDGNDISENLKIAQKKIGYLPEGAPLYEEMTPRGFLKFIGAARGLEGLAFLKAFDQVVMNVGLESVLDQRVETLSKGYRSRLGLAQALLHDPEILILDEPTDGLDPNQKHKIRGLIQSLSKNKVIIISTHNLEEVESICSRAIIIHQGKIVADGTPHELKTKSRYYNAVLIRGPVSGHKKLAAALEKLAAISGVEVTREGQSATLAVLAAGNKPPVGEIQKQLAKSRWPVEEISVDPGRLEDVFRTLTTTAEEAA